MNDAIIITMGKAAINNRQGGYRDLVRDFKICNGEEAVFYWTMGNKPKYEVVWAYIVIGNKIRWRARVGGVSGPGWKRFDHDVFSAKAWLELFGFEKVMPQIPMRGFQGFRYYNSTDNG